ncbi:hypothetical protein, partial [Acidomonas methanolica]|uniref:hypothetical protein n=1 Tax=Acidomonas methanolica TaxID=437 RepID=UPI0019553BD4
FSEEKEAKRLLIFWRQSLAGRLRRQGRRRFLVLFFKKEPDPPRPNQAVARAMSSIASSAR